MISRIYVLESLDENEWRTGKDLFDKIISKYNRLYHKEEERIIVKYSQFKSMDDFSNILNKIKTEVDEHEELILHIEAHGSKNNLFFNSDSANYSSWKSIFNELSKINKKTRNNLHVAMVTCYGRHIHVDNIDMRETSPYRTMISPSVEIYPKEIYDDYAVFYDETVKAKNIVLGERKLREINPNSNFFYQDTKAAAGVLIDIRYDSLCMSFNNDYHQLKSLFESIYSINLDELEVGTDFSKKKDYVKEKFIRRFCFEEQVENSPNVVP